MPRRSSSRRSPNNRSVGVYRDTIHLRLTDPSAMSNVGLYVSNRIELDTELGTLLEEITDRFEQWMLHSITVIFIPINGVSTKGYVGCTYLEDPEDTTPASGSNAMNSRHCAVRSAADFNGFKFHVPTSQKKGWLYCKDFLTVTDRWEAFGDIVFFSGSGDASLVPGILTAIVDFSCRYPVIDAVSVPAPTVQLQQAFPGLPAQVATSTSSSTFRVSRRPRS